MNNTSKILKELEKTGKLTERGMGKILNTVNKVEKALEKNAFNLQSILPVLKGAGVGALGMLATDAALGGAKAAINLYNKPGQQDFLNMLNANPDLSQYPQEEVEKIFGIIVQYAPDYAKNPTVSGNIVKHFIDYGAIDLASLKELIQGQKALQDVKQPPFAGAGQMGGLISSIMGNVDQAGPSLL